MPALTASQSLLNRRYTRPNYLNSLISQGSANILAPSQALPTHWHLPSSANTLASHKALQTYSHPPKLCQHTRISQALPTHSHLPRLYYSCNSQRQRISQPVAQQASVNTLSCSNTKLTPAYLAVSSLDPIYPNYLNSILGATSCCHE